MRFLLHADNPIHAELVRGMLAASGVPALVQGGELWNVQGGAGFGLRARPEVWVVRDEDWERAVELVEECQVTGEPYECEACGYDLRGLPEPRCPECGRSFPRGPRWTCPGCGEAIEEQFSACWQCGAERPNDANAAGADEASPDETHAAGADADS